jgi:hypothetical protein
VVMASPATPITGTLTTALVGTSTPAIAGPHGRWMLCYKCDGCGEELPDVLRRSVGDTGCPMLCTVCCSRFPGREWMRRPEEVGDGRQGLQ